MPNSINLLSLLLSMNQPTNYSQGAKSDSFKQNFAKNKLFFFLNLWPANFRINIIICDSPAIGGIKIHSLNIPSPFQFSSFSHHLQQQL
jgi:hypothetical protein